MESEKFIERIKELKWEFNIKHIKRLTSGRDARRIAILVVDEFLKLRKNEDVNDYQYTASVIEKQICSGVKALTLCCDRIPEEIRIAGLPWRKRQGIDPLELAWESYHYEMEQQLELTQDILRILGGETNGDQRSNNQTDFEVRGIKSVLGSVKSHPVKLAREIQSSLSETGK